MNIIKLLASFTDWEVKIVEFIQKMRNPFFDKFFEFISMLGDRYFFILLAAVAYWIYNKKFAFKMALSYLGSSLLTGILKAGIDRPRPYESVYHWVDLVGSPEGTSSFPSGHATATGSLSYSIFTENKGRVKWLKWVLLAFMILVPFSRLYLGVHHPSDVLAGLVIGIGFSLLIFKVIDMLGDNEHIWTLILIPVCLIVVIIGETALRNFEYGKIKDLYVVTGAIVGFVSGYYLEKKYVGYETYSKPLHQVLKVVGGLASTLILYFILGKIFDAINEESALLDFFRYGLLALFVSYVVPLVFKAIFKRQNESHQKKV